MINKSSACDIKYDKEGICGTCPYEEDCIRKKNETTSWEPDHPMTMQFPDMNIQDTTYEHEFRYVEERMRGRIHNQETMEFYVELLDRRRIPYIKIDCVDGGPCIVLTITQVDLHHLRMQVAASHNIPDGADHNDVRINIMDFISRGARVTTVGKIKQALFDYDTRWRPYPEHHWRDSISDPNARMDMDSFRDRVMASMALEPGVITNEISSGAAYVRSTAL